MSSEIVTELFGQFREVLTSGDFGQRSLPADWSWRLAVKSPASSSSNNGETSQSQVVNEGFATTDNSATTITTYEGVALLCEQILQLSPSNLLLFLVQTDCLDLLKTAFLTHEQLPLRYTFLYYLHPFLTLSYIYLHEYDLELVGSYAIAESQSDILRKREELLEQLVLLLVAFADKTIGNKAKVLNLSDNVSAVNAEGTEEDNVIVVNLYAAPLLELLAAHHDAVGQLHRLLDHLAGRSGSTSKQYYQKTQQQCYFRSVNLGPVVQKVLDKLCVDFFLLQRRLASVSAFEMTQATSLSTGICLMDAVLICILKQYTTQYAHHEALPALASSATQLQLALPKKESGAFLAVDTSSSAYKDYYKGDCPLNMQVFVMEWILQVLLPSMSHPVSGFSGGSQLLLLKDLIVFAQYPLLSSYRIQIYEHLWDYLVSCLSYYLDTDTEVSAEDVKMVDSDLLEEVLGLALLLFRYLAVSPETKRDVLQTRGMKLLQSIAFLVGTSSTTPLPSQQRQALAIRYLAEFLTTMLDIELLSSGAMSTVDCFEQLQSMTSISLNLPHDNSSGSAGNAVLYSGSVLKSLVQDAAGNGLLTLHRPDCFTATFVSVLGSTLYHTMETLERGLHPVHVSGNAVQEVDLLGESEDWMLALREYLSLHSSAQRALHQATTSSDVGSNNHLGLRAGWDVESNLLTVSALLAVLRTFSTPQQLHTFLQTHPAPSKPDITVTQCGDFLTQQYSQLVNSYLHTTELALFASHIFAPLMKWTHYQEASQSVLLLWQALAHVFLAPPASSSNPLSALLASSEALGPAMAHEWRSRQSDLHAVIAYSFENTAKAVTSELMLSQHIPVLFTFIVEVLLPYIHRNRADISDSETTLHKYVNVLLSFTKAVLFRSVEKKSYMEELQSNASLGLLGGIQTRDLKAVMLPHDYREDVEKPQLCIKLLSSLHRLLSSADSRDALGKAALEPFYHFILEVERALLYTEIQHYLSSSAALLALQQQQQYGVINHAYEDDIPDTAYGVQLLTSVLPLREEYFAVIRAVYSLVQDYNDRVPFNNIALIPVALPLLIDSYLQHTHSISVGAIRSWQNMPAVSAELDVMLRHLQVLAPHAINTSQTTVIKPAEEVDLLSLAHPAVTGGEIDLLDMAGTSSNGDSTAQAGHSKAKKSAEKRAEWLWQAVDKDRIRSQGMFSTSMTEVSSSALLHVVDTDALVQDVLLSRLPPDTESTPGEEEKQYQLNNETKLQSNVLLEYNEVAWTQLSAPNDALVVLASVVNTAGPSSLFTPARLSIRLRVINRTTFKIPFFNVYLLSKASHDYIQKSAEAYFVTKFRRNINTLPMSFDQLVFASRATAVDSATPILQAEYFPPNAMLEREVDLDVFAFASVDVVLRVEYPDLSKDGQALLVPGKSLVQNTVTSMAVGKKTNPSYLTHISDMHSNTTFTALVDCDSLYVPITALLMPYGYGAFDSLCSWQSASHVKTGIPWLVFLAQYHRLSGQYSHCVSVFSTLQSDASPVDTLVDCVRDSLHSNGGIGIHFLGLDCIALPVSPSQQAAGWCLQTLWGQEVSVLYVPSVLAEDAGMGKVTIRCESQAILSSVLNDVSHLIHGISAGYLVATCDDEDCI